MFRHFFVLSAGILLAACVSTAQVPIQADAAGKLGGRTLVQSRYEKPSFSATRPSRAMFGMIGAFAAISEGDELIATNKVEDPALAIGNELAKRIGKTYRTQITKTDTQADGDGVDDLAKTYGPGNLLLDIRTINWSFVYFPTDWEHYRVIYSAKLRLIDTQTKEVLAEGFCSRVPENSDTAPTYDELIAQNAARLKKELQISAQHCIDFFARETLKLS